MMAWISELYSGLGPIMQAVLTVSWQASVLAVMVLGVQAAFSRWLSARWRYALWSVVVVRLLLPVTPGSAVSVFNLFRGDPEAVVVTELPTVSVAGSVEAFDLSGFEPVAYAAGVQPVESVEPVNPWSTADIMLATWLAGAALVLGALLLINGLLVLRLRRCEVLNDPGVLELVESCKGEMGVRRVVRLVVDPRIASPALAGVFRPTLLLPAGLIDELPHNELRFILMHELAHAKRHDIAMNWLLIVLSALHWFNPLIWFTLSRLRADRELVRDAMVLRATGTDASQAYGQTIIRVLERLTRPRLSNPALAGVGDGMGQLKRRMRMIALSPKRRPALAAVGVVLLATLAAIGLTDAAEPIGNASDDNRDWAHVGQLVDELGQPVEGAEVFIATPKRHLSFKAGKSALPDTVSLLTVEDGKFWVPDQDGPFAVVVIDPRGYAEASDTQLKQIDPLVLKPWGSVEGTFSLDGLTQKGQTIGLEVSRRIGASQIYYWDSVQTLDLGRFSLDRVPPGEITLGLRTPVTRGYTRVERFEREQTLVLEPGQTQAVKLGGDGIMLTGRWVVQDDPDFSFDAYFVLAWLERVKADPAQGLRTVSVQVAHDGTLSANAVQPGEYRLGLQLYELRESPPWDMGKLLLDQTWPITLAADSDGQIGEFEVHAPNPSDKSGSALHGLWTTPADAPDPVTLAFYPVGKAFIIDEPNPAVHYRYEVNNGRLLLTGSDEQLEFSYQLAGTDLLLTFQDQTTRFVRSVPDRAQNAPDPNQSLRVDFHHTPLEDAFDEVRDLIDVPLFINWEALKASGVDRDELATMTVITPSPQTLVLTMLRASSDQRGLYAPAVEMIDGVLIASTVRDLNGSTDTRVYDIRDLLVQVPDFESEPLAPRDEVMISKQPEREKPSREELIGQLTDLICETVGYYDEWAANGGELSTIDELNGNLVIKTSLENHENIVGLLAQLREIRSPQISVESRFLFVTEQFAEESGMNVGFEDLPEGKRTRFLDDIEAHLIIRSAQASSSPITVTTPRMTLSNGQKAYIRIHQESAYTSDFRYIEDESGATYEPVINTINEGILLQAHATVSADRRYVTMTLNPTVLNVKHPIEKQRWEESPPDQDLFIEVPAFTQAEAETTVSIPDKGTIMIDLGTVSGPMKGVGDVVDAVGEGVERRVYVLVKPTIILQPNTDQEFPGLIDE